MKWDKSRWLQKAAIKKNVRNPDSLGFWFGGKQGFLEGRGNIKDVP